MSFNRKAHGEKVLRVGLTVGAAGLIMILGAWGLVAANIRTPITLGFPNRQRAAEANFFTIAPGSYWIEVSADTIDGKDTSALVCTTGIEIENAKSSELIEVHRLEYAGAIPSMQKQLYMATTEVPGDNIQVPLLFGGNHIKATIERCESLGTRNAVLSLTLRGDPTSYVIATQIGIVTGILLLLLSMLTLLGATLLRIIRR
jgi:hypothetical protein